MKKFYALLSAVLMSSMAFAQGTMTEENPILDELGYRLEKDVDWYAGTINGTSFCPEGYEMGSGVEALSYAATNTTGIKINKQDIYQCMNDGMEWFYLQLAGNGIACTPGKYGLRTTSNERWIVLNGLRGGQIIAVDLSNSDPAQFVTSSTECNGNTGWADTMTDPLQVYEITDSIHALQEIAGGEGTADTFRYFQVNPESNGWLYAKFNGKKPAQSMWRMQIWSDKNDAEAVSAPIFSMKGVYGKDRRIGIKPGTSTFNSEVLTYYSIDGSEPLFLEETDEIERIDSVAIEGEEGEEIVWQVDTIYKKVAVQYEGEWGDFCYDTSLGDEAFITITEAEDEDGDGYITVKARTVSVNGAYSEVTEMAYQIGEIYLNAPTLTPVGMNGVERDYQIGWTNNTLCGEEYTITTTIDGDFPTTEYALGDVVSAALSIKVLVEVEGYEPAETEITVLEQGTEFFVKPVADSENMYFWDFVNLTQEQVEKIDHQWVESAFVADSVTSDTTWYTRQQYLDGECPDEAEPVFGYFGWDELDSRQAGRHWQTLNRFEETVVGSEGQDSIVYTFEYAGDLTDLFHDGFVYENSYGGTYPDHWSNTAIFTNGALLNDGNHGLYNNSNHATITVPNVQYGEYVVYTTSTGSVCEPCQVGETETAHTFGYTKDLGKNVYLYSVGVYTQENLPDAIEHITAPTERVNKNLIFDLSGRRVKNPVSGIYIKNGKKYLIK